MRQRGNPLGLTPPVVLVGLAGALAIGLASPTAPVLAFLIAVLPVIAIAMTVEPWVLVAGAAVIPWLSRLATTTGFAPKFLDFADFGAVLVAFVAAIVAALTSDRELPAESIRIVRGVAVFATAIVVSALVNLTQIERLFAGLLLTLEAFILLAAILLAPPGRRGRQGLIMVLIGICALQAPFAFWQWLTNDNPDEVKGTLLEAGAGHHVMAGGLIVIMFAGVALAKRRSAMVGIAAVVLLIGAAADAKQAMFVAPVAYIVGVIAMRARNVGGTTHRRLGSALLVGGAFVVVLLVFAPVDTALDQLNRTRDTGGGKPALTAEMADDLLSAPLQGSFGFGPGETVSRFGYLTTILTDTAEQTRALGLGPGKLTEHYDEVVRGSGFVADSSFSSGQSSLLGVAGDYGFFGVFALGSLLWSIASGLRRKATPLAHAAMSSWIMVLPLAYIFDWLEQPPFMLVVAIVTGLALTESISSETFDGSESLPLVLPRTAAGRRRIGAPAVWATAMLAGLVLVSGVAAATRSVWSPDAPVAVAKVRIVEDQAVVSLADADDQRRSAIVTARRAEQVEQLIRSGEFDERVRAIADSEEAHVVAIDADGGQVRFEVRGLTRGSELLADRYRQALLAQHLDNSAALLGAQLSVLDRMDEANVLLEDRESLSRATIRSGRNIELDDRRRQAVAEAESRIASLSADGPAVLSMTPTVPFGRSLAIAVALGTLWSGGFGLAKRLLGRRLHSGADVERALVGNAPPVLDLTASSLAEPAAFHPVAQQAVNLARQVPTPAQLLVVSRGDLAGEARAICAQLQQSVRELAPFEPLTVVPGLDAPAKAPIGVVITMRAGATTKQELRRVVSDAERSLKPILGVMLYRSLSYQSLTYQSSSGLSGQADVSEAQERTMQMANVTEGAPA